jgi:hypothetical protein
MGLTNDEQVSLGNLARGAAIERFQDELKKALENILDPNTGMKDREIILRVKLKPASDDRKTVKVQVFCASKLAPPAEVPTLIFLGRSVAGAVAFEHNPDQMQLPITKPDAPHLVGAGEKE